MKDLVKDVISLARYLSLRLSDNDNKEIVLLYHSVGRINHKDDPYKLNIDPDLFEKQIQLISCFKNRRVTVTFDDGFDNIFEYAIPAILRDNIKSIIFVTCGFIDGKISLNSFFNNKVNIKPLNWKQIREISDSGIEIGSHSLTHLNLAILDERIAQIEVRDSKKKIEDAIGKEVKYFAYPYGSKKTFNNRIKQIVKDSGYEMAYTNIMGFNDVKSDAYELRRIRLYNYDNIFRFKMKINGAYNWVDYLNNF